MSEMIKRIALAMATSDGEDYMEDFAAYDRRARAAIEAMSPPAQVIIDAAIFNRLMPKQQPLGDEFAKVLHENAWDLYETDAPRKAFAMTEIDAGIVEKVARAIRRRRIDLLGHTPAPDDMLDLSAGDVAFARAAITAYEEAKAERR
jgi:hypothetical protein